MYNISPLPIEKSIVINESNYFERVCIKTLLATLVFPQISLAAAADSSLISQVKQYILDKTDYKTRDQFFTAWSKDGKPTVIVYVTPSTSIGRLDDRSSMIVIHGSNESFAKKTARRYDSLGFHTLMYKTYATSSAELSPRFLSYSPVEQCFIILHEFGHHYIRDKHLNIPFDYQESLCEVIGNYGTIEFASQSSAISKKMLLRKIEK